MPALPLFFYVGLALETTKAGEGGDTTSDGNTESLSSQEAAGADLGTGLGAGRNGSGWSSGGGSSADAARGSWRRRGPGMGNGAAATASGGGESGGATSDRGSCGGGATTSGGGGALALTFAVPAGATGVVKLPAVSCQRGWPRGCLTRRYGVAGRRLCGRRWWRGGLRGSRVAARWPTATRLRVW